MKFDYDKRKSASNKTKHGITFEEASTAFADELSITINDPLHSEEEDRLILIGQSKQSKTLVVIHVERKEAVRIISARKATKHEQKFYEEY